MPFSPIGEVVESAGGAANVAVWGKTSIMGKAEDARLSKFAAAHVYFVAAEFYLGLM
jgi:hypothetical protein